MGGALTFSISFVLAIVASSLCIGLTFRREVVLMFPIGACIVIALDCLVGQLLSAIGITVALWAIIVINLLLPILFPVLKRCCIGISPGSECAQRRSRSNITANCISFSVIFAFVALCGLIQFGPDLNLNYASTDAAAHFWDSMQIAFGNEGLSGLFLTHYETALWIQAMVDVVEYYDLYQVFIIVDLGFLFLFGALFYSFTQLLSRPLRKPIALAFTIFCLAGYPLNNVVFGFSYLGAGVLYCFAFTSILVISRGTGMRSAGYVLACLFIYATSISYSLFLPVELLLALAAFIVSLSAKGVSPFALAILGFAVSAVCVVGVAIVLKSGFAKGLTADGYIYKDLFWSLIPIMPLALYGFLRNAKSEDGIVSLLFVAVFVCTIGSLALFLLDCFSAYYYYKFYYLLWPALFLLGSIGFSRFVLKKDLFAIVYIVIILALFGISIFGIDSKISAKYPSLCPSPVANPLFGVYTFNLSQMGTDPISPDEVELFSEGDNLSEEGEYIPMVGTNIDVYWHEAITQTRNEDRRFWYYWLYDSENQEEEFIERLSDARHLIVLNAESIDSKLGDYLSDKRIVFSNNAGTIYELSS